MNRKVGYVGMILLLTFTVFSVHADGFGSEEETEKLREQIEEIQQQLLRMQEKLAELESERAEARRESEDLRDVPWWPAASLPTLTGLPARICGLLVVTA